LPTTRHRCNLDCVSLGAKPRRWAPLTRDTRKGIKQVKWRFDFDFLYMCIFCYTLCRIFFKLY